MLLLAPLDEFGHRELERGDFLPLSDPDLAHNESRVVGSLHVTRNVLVALVRGLLDVFSFMPQIEPPDLPTLVQRHSHSSPDCSRNCSRPGVILRFYLVHWGTGSRVDVRRCLLQSITYSGDASDATTTV